jgi:hypothetical protein
MWNDWGKNKKEELNKKRSVVTSGEGELLRRHQQI